MSHPSLPLARGARPSGTKATVLVVLGLAAVPLTLLWVAPPADRRDPIGSAPAPAARARRTGPDNTSAPLVAAPSALPSGAPPALAGRAASGCGAGPCGGSAGPELRRALVERVGQAQSCYRSSLFDRPGLRGTLTLSVRVGSGGQVCSAAVTGDDLGDPLVAACVTNLVRTGRFPAPDGGCVDAVVPMNFVPKP